MKMANNKKDWKDIWVVFEQYNGKVPEVSWEILGKARDLADKSKQKVVAVILGHNMDEVAQEAIYRGADHVYYAEHELLAHYSYEAYAKIVTDLVQKHKPNILLLSATHNGRDLAGRLAVRLKTGLTADAIYLDIDPKTNILKGAVPGFGGSIVAVITIPESRPQMATTRPGVLLAKEPDTKRKGKIEKFTPDIPEGLIKTKHLQTIKVEKVDISKAKRIVAAGRGVGNDLSLIDELAEVLDAAVGVTRPLADIGLKPRETQIGSTGVTVRPDLALIFGVSGATHFTAGIQDSGTIISVNIDKEALIFENSDYCIVADVNEVLPKLLDKLKAKLVSKTK